MLVQNFSHNELIYGNKFNQPDQDAGENTAPSRGTTTGPPASEQPSEGTGAELPPQPEGQAPDQPSNPAQMPDGDGQGNVPEGQYNNMGIEMNQNGFPNMGWNDGSAYNQMAQFMPNGMPHPGMGPFQHSMGMFSFLIFCNVLAQN